MAQRIRNNSLANYLYNDCRIMLLHIIGSDYKKFSDIHRINVQSVQNFIKWSYSDYVLHTSDKVYRYLSIENCIKILEMSGYEIRLSLVLKNNTENEV